MGLLSMRFQDGPPVLVIECNSKGCTWEMEADTFYNARMAADRHIKDSPECGRRERSPQFTFNSVRKIEITTWDGKYR